MRRALYHRAALWSDFPVAPLSCSSAVCALFAPLKQHFLAGHHYRNQTSEVKISYLNVPIILFLPDFFSEFMYCKCMLYACMFVVYRKYVHGCMSTCRGQRSMLLMFFHRCLDSCKVLCVCVCIGVHNCRHTCWRLTLVVLSSLIIHYFIF